MRTATQNLGLVRLLLAGILTALVSPLSGQTFETLHEFTATSASYPPTNSDGALPSGGLILSGATLFGTAEYGGASANGTVFSISTNGTNFTNLYSFTGLDSNGFNSDGTKPDALVLSGATLFGAASEGGSSRVGTVFALNVDGTSFTTLYNFSARDANGFNSDGALPSGLTLSSNALYGTAAVGGAADSGTVFTLADDGSAFVTLYSFSGHPNDFFYGTNADGANPKGLILSGNTLYGTARGGGGAGNGTVFAINTDGSAFRVLHTFAGPTFKEDYPFRNSDGAWPGGALVLSGNTIYGTTLWGGVSGGGTVFALNIDGTGFTTLHTFKPGFPNETNTGGAFPNGLILSGSTLYGSTQYAGNEGGGTVFALSTDGTGFAVLHNFPPGVTNTDTNSSSYNYPTNSDGAMPLGSLALLGTTLYGITSEAGSGGVGTIFSISFPPQLNITASGADLILTWPTNYAGFDYSAYSLQSTTNLASPIWTSVSPAPVVVNGQNTVTNPISGAQQFFRLAQ